MHHKILVFCSISVLKGDIYFSKNPTKIVETHQQVIESWHKSLNLKSANYSSQHQSLRGNVSSWKNGGINFDAFIYLHQSHRCRLL